MTRTALRLMLVCGAVLCASACSKGTSGDGASGSLPAGQLELLKQGTVLVRTASTTGSGFLVRVEAPFHYLLTNAHVVGAAPGVIHVTYSSGTQDELTLDAEPVDVLPQGDLALLRTRGEEKRPGLKPLPGTTAVRETMNLYALGFPFGDLLNSSSSRSPAVTVSRGSVSSLRFGDVGELEAIQLDGNLNPGNSGGPVVTNDGSVVGVATARLREGEAIGLLIPWEQVQQFLQGARASFEFSGPQRCQSVCSGRLVVQVHDPFQRTSMVTLRRVPADQIPASLSPPFPKLGELVVAVPRTPKRPLSLEAELDKVDARDSIQLEFLQADGIIRGPPVRLWPSEARPQAHSKDAGPGPGVESASVTRPPSDTHSPSTALGLGEEVNWTAPAKDGDLVVVRGVRGTLIAIDVKKRREVWRISEDPVSPFAAGGNALVLYRRRSNQLVRYELDTFRQTDVQKNPFVGDILQLYMGSASPDVALALWRNGAQTAISLLSAKTLTPLGSPLADLGRTPKRSADSAEENGTHFLNVGRVHPGRLGTSFLLSSPYDPRCSFEILYVKGRGRLVQHAKLPSGRGTLTLTNDDVPLDTFVGESVVDSFGEPGFKFGYPTLPALDASVLLVPTGPKDADAFALVAEGNTNIRTEVPWTMADFKSLHLAQDSFDRFLFLHEASQTLVIFPPGKAAVWFYDFRGAWGERTPFYPRSTAETWIEPGERFVYQFNLRVREGVPKLTLVKSPPGSTLGVDGLLQWRAPANWRERTTRFTIVSEDGSHQKVWQTVLLNVRPAH